MNSRGDHEESELISFHIELCLLFQHIDMQITPFGLTDTDTVGGRNDSKIVSEVQRGKVFYAFIYKRGKLQLKDIIQSENLQAIKNWSRGYNRFVKSNVFHDPFLNYKDRFDH